MAAEKKDHPLKQFTDITVQELKAIAASGAKLTSEALLSRLSDREEIESIINPVPPVEEPDQAALPDDDAEINRLKSQVETYQDQKEKLLRQLDEADESERQHVDFSRRVFLGFCELLRTEENRAIHIPLEEFKEAVKTEHPVARLEEIYQQIRDIAMKEEAPRDAPAPSIFSKWLKRDTDTPVSQETAGRTLSSLKKAYSDLIHELKLNLDNAAFEGLSRVENQLKSVRSLEDFFPVREAMVALIQDYIAQVSGEREEAAAFIREIGKRLIEVESHILDSLPPTRDTLRENGEFNDLLEVELQGLRRNVDFSKSLAELKEAVISSLATIQNAIREKREKDSVRMAVVEEKMQSLQQNLIHMKEEVSSAKQRAEALEEESLVDALTGVYNRRAYDRRMNEELQRFIRYGSGFSIVILDVDHFKSVNDQYGHAVGDLCLKEIVNRVRPLLRDSDFLARFGGEEFVILLPETDRNGAGGVAEKLRQCIENTEFLHRGDRVGITISLGVTEVTADDQTAETLFIRVDQALYRAKNEGRNRVAFG